MKAKTFLFYMAGLLIVSSLTSCSEQNAYIVNNTSDTIKIRLTQQYRDESKELQYLEFFDVTKLKKFTDRFDNVRYEKSVKYKILDDYDFLYDSLTNSAILTMMPGEIFFLGSILIGDRKKIQDWEFNKLEVFYKDGILTAQNDGLLNLAEQNDNLLTQPDYYIYLGRSSDFNFSF